MNIDIAGIEFPITIDLDKKELSGTVPSELIVRELRSEVDKYDGYSIKDTKFNRWKVNDIDLDGLTNGGIKVSIAVNLKHREKIVSIFGKTHYTPWVSVSLKGKAEFSASVTNNIIAVKHKSHNIKGDGWYSGIVELLANDLFADEVEDALDKAMSNFNGVSIVSFLKKGSVTNTGAINIPLDDLLNSVTASVQILQNGIKFVVKLPSQLILT